MSITEQKITQSDVESMGVVSLPDVLTGTAAENKALFDRLVREVVSQRFNSLVDALSAESGAGEIGAAVEGLDGETVQELLAALKEYIDNITLQSGSVSSVFGRAGNIVAQAGDYTAEMVGAARPSTTHTVTLAASGWSGGSYTLSVEGVTATSNQEILPAVDITRDQLDALQKANIQDAGQAAGSLVLKAFGTVPTDDLPIRIIVRGDS